MKNFDSNLAILFVKRQYSQILKSDNELLLFHKLYNLKPLNNRQGKYWTTFHTWHYRKCYGKNVNTIGLPVFTVKCKEENIPKISKVKDWKRTESYVVGPAFTGQRHTFSSMIVISKHYIIWIRNTSLEDTFDKPLSVDVLCRICVLVKGE